MATASGLSHGETGAAQAAPDDAPSSASMSAPETMTERVTIDVFGDLAKGSSPTGDSSPIG
jgi:hypothetical protein